MTDRHRKKVERNRMRRKYVRAQAEKNSGRKIRCRESLLRKDDGSWFAPLMGALMRRK